MGGGEILPLLFYVIIPSDVPLTTLNLLFPIQERAAWPEIVYEQKSLAHRPRQSKKQEEGMPTRRGTVGGRRFPAGPLRSTQGDLRVRGVCQREQGCVLMRLSYEN